MDGNSGRKKPKNYSRRKRNFAIFYIITLIIGLAVCVALFAVAYQTLVPPRITIPSSDRDNEDTADFVRVEHEQILGMVTAVETFAPRSVTLHMLESGRSARFYMTDATVVQNRRGAPIGFGEIELGQLVDVTFDANTQEASAVSISSHAWEENHQGNFNINLDNATITIGNRVLSYSSRTMVLNRGETTSISLINPADAIRIIGYNEKIWSIRIESGHGFIRFDNADRIVNGTVTIGNSVFAELDGGRPIAVVEGTHRVIINGQNIETFMRDVVVRQGETVAVNLAESDMALRKGTLQLIINDHMGMHVPQASVFINGSIVTLENNLIEIEFGEHLLRVEAPDFVPVQQAIELDQPFLRMELSLVRDVSTASVLIETFPSDAQVFVGDTFVGNSPVTAEIEIGTHMIVARRPGYEDRSLNIVVVDVLPRQFMLHMVQQPMHPPTAPIPPGGQQPLPPLHPDVTPVPSPTIPPDQFIPEDIPSPDVVWPPLIQDLPVPDPQI